MAERDVKITITYKTVGKGKLKESEKGLKKLGAQVYKLEKEFKRSLGKATAVIIKQTKETTRLSKQSGRSFDAMGFKLVTLAWHFRFLGNVFTRVSKQLIRMAKDWFEVATDIEESFFSIRAATALYGHDTEEATKMAQELAETGLVPLTVAADSLRNLLLTGIGLPKIERLTYRYLDVASLATSGAKGLAQSFETITASIVRGSLVLSKDVAARGIWNQTNKRLQETMGVVLKDLTAQQRAIEILTTIEEDFTGTEGLHRIEMLQMSATIGRLNTAYQDLKRTLAAVLRPALEFVTKHFISFVKMVGRVVDFLGRPFLGAIGAATLGFITLSGVVLTLIALFISIVKVWGIATAFLVALNIKTLALVVSTNASTKALLLNKLAWIGLKAVTWEIWAIMGAIAAVIGVVTWLVMKMKGTFGKTAEKIKATEIELEELRKTIIASGEEFKGFSSTIQDTLDRITELEKGISDKRRDYERDLARLVKKHSDAWHKAAKDVEGAKLKMEESLADLTKSHEESIEDEEFAYKRRREDVLEEIDREVAKGLWADQMKIKAAKKTLKRLDEDHTRALDKESKRYEKRKKSVLETYKDELDKAREAMEKINTLWQKHRAEVAKGIKLMATLPDEFEKIAESFAENTKDEREALIKLYAEIDKVKTKIKELFAPLKKLGTLFVTALTKPMDLLVDFPGTLETLKSIGISVFNALIKGASEAHTELRYLTDVSEELATKWKELRVIEEEGKIVPRIEFPKPFGRIGPRGEFIPFEYQFGGIIPGPRNQPVPILAHGGERVIPAGEVGGGGNINITINASVREQEDINRIARAVSQVMGQRARWRRLGG